MIFTEDLIWKVVPDPTGCSASEQTCSFLPLIQKNNEDVPILTHPLVVVLVGYEFLLVADEDAFLLFGVGEFAALQVVDGIG